MICVNLKEMFGDRFKVAHEESYHAEHGEHGRTEDPWLMILLCRHGHICPWGGSNLAACTFKNGPVAGCLRRLPFVDGSLSQDGDDGINAVFTLEHFDEAARIMKPRRRRRLSAEQRRAAVDRLRAYQPAKGESVQSLVRKRPKST